MQPLFFPFDLVLAVLSIRSIVVLRRAAPWTSAGWAGTLGYACAAGIEYGDDALHRPAALVAYAFVVLLAVAFVVAGIRDEAQAEPWWWPVRLGRTRAERQVRPGS